MDFERVQSEALQTHTVRAPLYQQLQRRLKRRVIGFYTTFEGSAIIETPDAEMLEEVIKHTPGPKPITLILHSPGGDPVEAERIVRVFRKMSGDDFEVIVPRMAKSAATLICMGADRIVMSDTAELGPVDPQVPWRTIVGFRHYPARTLVDVYDSLMNGAKSTGGNVEPYLQQLQMFNAGEVGEWRKYEMLTKQLALKLLRCCQMKKGTDKAILHKIRIFTESSETLDHARPIFAETAKEVGLNIHIEATHSDLWKDIWELYARSSYLLGHPEHIAKLCESNKRSAMSRSSMHDVG